MLLAHDEALPAGERAAVLEPRDLASGVYLYRLRAGAFVRVHRMVLRK